MVFQVVLGQLFFQGGRGVEVNHGVSVSVGCFAPTSCNSLSPSVMNCDTL